MYCIRNATKLDVEQIVKLVDLERNKGMGFYRRSWIQTMVCGRPKRDKPQTVIVITFNDEIIAVATMRTLNRRVNMLCVHEKHRNNKLGELLLLMLEPDCITATDSSCKYFERLGYKIKRR